MWWTKLLVCFLCSFMVTAGAQAARLDRNYSSDVAVADSENALKQLFGLNHTVRAISIPAPSVGGAPLHVQLRDDGYLKFSTTWEEAGSGYGTRFSLRRFRDVGFFVTNFSSCFQTPKNASDDFLETISGTTLETEDADSYYTVGLKPGTVASQFCLWIKREDKKELPPDME
jgi:hypothetical protein